jgi:PIN domain nuclease of toxin-antitoxin system
LGHDEVIVADTHAIVWWILSPSILSQRARTALDSGPVHVPIISCLEIANLTRRGRIELPLEVGDWLNAMLQLPNVLLSPFTLPITVAAGLLNDPIRDPADRLIVATALHLGAPLVTTDAKIRAAGVVETIW